MALRARTFLVTKGDRLDEVTQFLLGEIGLDGWLIEGIQSVPINNQVTKLTLLYRSQPDFPVDLISPPDGGVFTTGISIDHAELLFSLPLDPSSVTSGAIRLNNVGLSGSRINVDPGGYLLHVNLSGLPVSGFNELLVDSQVLKFTNNRSLPYSQAAGFVLHENASTHLGDLHPASVNRRRGRTTIRHLPLEKSILPQRAISEYLTGLGLSEDRLISFTSSSRGNGVFDVYFVYYETLEPQIVSGFPFVRSLFPDVAPPDNMTLVFREPIDVDQARRTDGLFVIQDTFNTVNEIPSSDVSILDDGRVVRLSTTGLFTQKRVYNIQARSGLRSLVGDVLQKPLMWPIVVDAYTLGPGGDTIISGGSGQPSTTGGLRLNPSNELEIIPGFGFTMPTVAGNPINIHLSNGLTGAGTGQPIGVNVDNTYISISNNEVTIPASSVTLDRLAYSPITGGVTGLEKSGNVLNVVLDNSTITLSAGQLAVLQGGITHGNLAGLSSDDHTIYTLADGSRAFTNPVAGIAPTSSSHLTTKGYTDGISGFLSSEIDLRATGSQFDQHTGDLSIHFTKGSVQLNELGNVLATGINQQLLFYSGSLNSWTGANLVGQGTVSVAYGGDEIRISGSQGVTGTTLPIQFHEPATGLWTNFPSSSAFLFNSTQHIHLVDLTPFTQCRLVANILGAAGAIGSELQLKYNGTFSTTVGDYSDVGVSKISVEVDTANSVQASQWITVADLARSDVYLAVVGISGDDTEDPEFGTIYAHFR